MDALELFRILVKERGSDLIIKATACPAMRVDGRVKYLSESQVPDAFARNLMEQVLGENERRHFDVEGEVDTSYELDGVGRFRANVFRQRGRLCMVFRHVLDHVPGFKALNLPQRQMQELASLQRGLVLATGTAGSGKTTTLAAMVEFMNHHFQRHIVTVEDPIEYVFTDRKSMINQREIGFDTRNFSTALRHVVRQTPDVIVIGEMRDAEAVAAALSAAETGHLVLSSLHTVNAVQTVERILSFFPPHQHQQIRLQMSLTLEGIVSQRLLPRKNSEGRVPALEILLGTPRIRELLHEGLTLELPKAIEEGSHYYGTQTFLQSLRDLFVRSMITHDDAMAAADNPDELKLELSGVTRGSKASDFDFKF